jgi:hypothetical protein
VLYAIVINSLILKGNFSSVIQNWGTIGSVIGSIPKAKFYVFKIVYY